MTHEDPFSIPEFLRRTSDKPRSSEPMPELKSSTVVVVADDLLKPVGMSKEEWEQVKIRRKQKAPVAKAVKAPVEKIDTRGKRWNPRRGRWEIDPFDKLTTAARPAAKPFTDPFKAFAVTPGSWRFKLLTVFVKKKGRECTLEQLSKEVYDSSERSGATVMVIKGLMDIIESKNLPFGIERTEAGGYIFFDA